eukprot:TRINITY_DN2067_c0_g1_i2.p1 TRINITY_DN2067_c0_g1~~TRINITY_DN2067_c0_g1_i2.p1  ORF type:complete len:696 (-),score=170.44 TRINITY_DN2067_c0_g1_i2:247-2208(-)
MTEPVNYESRHSMRDRGWFMCHSCHKHQQVYCADCLHCYRCACQIDCVPATPELAGDFKILIKSKTHSTVDNSPIELLCNHSRRGYLKAIKSMLDRDPYLLFEKDYHGNTPLYYAILCYQEAVVREYFRRGVKVDLLSVEGNRYYLAAQSKEIRELIVSQSQGHKKTKIKTNKKLTLYEYNTRSGFRGRIPCEIFVQVLKHLTDREIIVASMVCKEWRILSESNVVWRPIWQSFFADEVSTSLVLSANIDPEQDGFYKSAYLFAIRKVNASWREPYFFACSCLLLSCTLQLNVYVRHIMQMIAVKKDRNFVKDNCLDRNTMGTELLFNVNKNESRQKLDLVSVLQLLEKCLENGNEDIFEYLIHQDHFALRYQFGITDICLHTLVSCVTYDRPSFIDKITPIFHHGMLEVTNYHHSVSSFFENSNVFHSAAAHGKIECLRKLIGLYPNGLLMLYDNTTPLMCAISSGQQEMVIDILQNAPQDMVPQLLAERDDDGYTPLLLTVLQAIIESDACSVWASVFENLIIFGSDLSAKTKMGNDVFKLIEQIENHNVRKSFLEVLKTMKFEAPPKNLKTHEKKDVEKKVPKTNVSQPIQSKREKKEKRHLKKSNQNKTSRTKIEKKSNLTKEEKIELRDMEREAKGKELAKKKVTPKK